MLVYKHRNETDYNMETSDQEIGEIKPTEIKTVQSNSEIIP